MMRLVTREYTHMRLELVGVPLLAVSKTNYDITHGTLQVWHVVESVGALRGGLGVEEP